MILSYGIPEPVTGAPALRSVVCAVRGGSPVFEALLLAFGAQVLGPAGSKVWVDDAFVKLARASDPAPAAAASAANQHLSLPPGSILSLAAEAS